MERTGTCLCGAVSFTAEFFIDKKPEAYSLAGERKTLTEAEVVAMFSGG